MFSDSRLAFHLITFRGYQKTLAQWFLVCALGVIIISMTQFAVIDDAYISFRHAYNLTTTGELVFNSGERVEGMTNLLWTLLIAGNAFFDLLPPERFAVIASLVCLFWVALRLLQLGQLLRVPFYATLASCGLLFLTPDFLLANTNGLEGGLYTALLLEMVFWYYRGRMTRAFVAAALLFLTRPESLALGVLLAAISFFENRSWRRIIPGICVLGTVVMGVTLWRLAYYGSPIPNSLIAKSMPLHSWMGRPGFLHFKLSLAYLAKFAFANWHFVLVIASALGAFGALWRRHKAIRGLLALCLGGLLFSVLIIFGNGGDWMPHSRLIMYYGTLCAVLLLILMAHRLAPALVVALVIVYPVLLTEHSAQQTNHKLFSLSIDPGPDTFDGSLSERLRPCLLPGDVLSAEALGYISFQFSQNYVHDPVGLANKYLARNGTPSITFGKCDPTYTVGVVRPTVLVWHHAAHLGGVPQQLLDQYETFCAANCGTESADIVMIRRDQAKRFEPFFADWQAVRMTTEGREELLAQRPRPESLERPSLRASVLW